jgi:hypothetical protein
LENTPMARPTAPSLWLLGFDPAASALPHRAEPISLPLPCEPARTIEAEPVENLSDVEQEQFVATVRANWRVEATATAAAPRILWPRLTRTDLEHLTGVAAKFEANLAAIATLQQIEAEHRSAERGRTPSPAALHGLGWNAREFQPRYCRRGLGRTCPSPAGDA